VIILDELHRSMGFKTVESLRKNYPNAIFLGFSATPSLGDPNSKRFKRAEEYLGECIMSITLPDAFEMGALAPMRSYLYWTEGEAIEKFKNDDDISDKDFEMAIDAGQRTEIAEEILSDYLDEDDSTYAQDAGASGTGMDHLVLTEKALVYCAGVDHAKSTAEYLGGE
jgi:superfamily II DNA or RNA helicase